MPSKTKLKNAAIAAKSATLPTIPKELIDQSVAGPMAFKQVFIELAIERLKGVLHD